jgi:hypothetical protein
MLFSVLDNNHMHAHIKYLVKIVNRRRLHKFV